MNEHDGILQGHYDAALEQISNLTRERDEARRQLVEAVALQSIQYSRLSHFQADQENMSHVDISNWCDDAMAYYPTSAALLLALGKAAVIYVERSRTDILEAKKRWNELWDAVEAALADPVLAQVLREAT